MATVKDVLKRCEAMMARKFLEAGSPLNFLRDNILIFVKDCYDEITDYVRIPRVSDSSTVSVADQRSYSLPVDIWDGVDGIIDLEYDDRPLQRRSLREVKEKYSDELQWWEPEELTQPEIFFLEDDESSVSILKTPPDDGKVIKFTYVQEVEGPDAVTDLIPDIFKPYVRIMPLFILGRLYEMDKRGAGSEKLAQWEFKLKNRKWQKDKNRGRRTGRETFSEQLKAYHRRF